MIRPRDRSRRGPHMSATPDSVFTNPEQRIADLERQLAGCKAELAEALQRENATAEVLGVINSSPGDLAPVFNAMLKMALTLCGATFGDLLTYSNELFHVSAEVHSENETAKRKNPFPALPGGLLDAIVRGEHVVFAEDILEHGDYRRNPKFRELVDSGGYRSVLAVALRKEGALVGALAVFRKEVGRLPTSRSRYCRTSQRRRSSRWRTPACWANCASAPAICRNRLSTRPRPATCSKSSAARPPMSSRCWTH